MLCGIIRSVTSPKLAIEQAKRREGTHPTSDDKQVFEPVRNSELARGAARGAAGSDVTETMRSIDELDEAELETCNEEGEGKDGDVDAEEFSIQDRRRAAPSEDPPPPSRRRSKSPKGGIVEWLRLWFLAGSESQKDDGDDGAPNSKRNNRSSTLGMWMASVRRRIDDLKGRIDDRTLKSLATSFALTTLVLVLHRQRRATRRRTRIASGGGVIGGGGDPSSSSFRSAVEAPLSLLHRSTRAGQVHTALVGGPAPGESENVVYYRLNANNSGVSDNLPSSWRKSVLPAAVAKDFINALSMHCDNVSALPDDGGGALVRTSRPFSVLPILTTSLPFAYLFLLYRVLKDGLLSGALGGGGSDKSSEAVLKMMNPQTTQITFDDVAGMTPQVVTDLREVVAYLSDPRRYRAVGARPPRAVLLHGPPGSGKTLLAQAVAGEANVPFFACSASEFVEVYVGRGAARIRALFAQARKAAVQQQQQQRNQQHNSNQPPGPHQYIHSVLHSMFPWLASQLGAWDVPSSSPVVSPSASSSSAPRCCRPAASILFIDELDALGKSRMSAGSNDEREQTLNQLLTELDGFGTREREFTNNEEDDHGGGDDAEDEEAGTVIVIAATNRVDVLDPAILRRFDRQIHVGYPATPKARKDVLLVHARRVRCGADVDWDRIASDARTLGCSGADLANLVNEAALLAVREGSSVIEQDQLDHAARRIQNMKWREDHPGDLLLGLRSAGIR